jgi:hypothetical protein
VRLHVDRLFPVPDPDGLVRAARQRGRDQHVTTRATPHRPRQCLDVGERAQPRAPAGRYDLRELGQRRDRRGFQTLDGDGRAQPEGNGGHLVRVEQQWWHRTAGRQPVAAGPARLAVDAIADLAELGDVPPRGPLGDAEPFRELRGGDARVRLEQRERLEASVGGAHSCR